MTSSDRFKPIQKLAEKKEREAAAAFGKTLKTRDDAQHRLDDLRQYHKEYLDRFSAATRNGICGAQIQEYQAFIAKLEEAIGEQKRALQAMEVNCEHSKQEWRGKYSKSKAMDTAVDRLKEEEMHERERREQNASDDHSQRRR